MRTHLSTLLVLSASLVIHTAALAQDCEGCGDLPPPSEGYGGCGCGGGSVLVQALTDLEALYLDPHDYDRDAIPDPDDNCRSEANPDQLDTDGDGIGDACDNCVELVNLDQFDLDGDRQGDACDLDLDGDTILNEFDNCALIPNAITTGRSTQADLDGDGVGDACDDDLDGDAIANTEDECPFLVGSGDTEACFPDFDGDGVSESLPTSADLCPTIFDPEQLDTDGDELGDRCDPDADGDDVLDLDDNCELVANPKVDGMQPDADRDGRGDACDDTYCFVVLGDEAGCLDPSSPLDLYIPPLRASAHALVRLPLFVNVATPVSYRWSVLDGPAGAAATLRDPEGVATATSLHELAYSRPVAFSSARAGSYLLRVEAESEGESDSYDVEVLIDDAPAPNTSGCRVGARGGHGPIWVLLGLVFLRRREP